MITPPGASSAITLARHLVQCELGRELHRDEVVHHIDGDQMNDVVENLVVLSRSEHAAVHRAEITAAMRASKARTRIGFSTTHQQRTMLAQLLDGLIPKDGNEVRSCRALALRGLAEPSPEGWATTDAGRAYLAGRYVSVKRITS